jgi:rhomboid protease GluP
LNTDSSPPDLRTFQVRYGPEKLVSYREQWANNLELTQAGTVEVTREFVRVSDGRNSQPEARRTFAMDDIANVSFSEAERIIALRTRSGDRVVHLWMGSAEDARDLLERLPRTTTPEFVEQLRQYEQHRENVKAIAPKVRVTPVIIGLNVFIFAIMALAGAGLAELNPAVHLQFGANYGPLTWHGQPWRLLASAFIHFGVMHIALNMYALYSGGVLAEQLFGSARFAVIYLLAAVAGSVVSGWWDDSRLSAGASGAVFGVYGAMLAYFARWPRAIPMDMLKSARSGAILLCVYSLAFGAVAGFVDNAAHVGGLLGGAISGYLLARPFEARARAVARPWQVAAVAVLVCAALALLSARLWWR